MNENETINLFGCALPRTINPRGIDDTDLLINQLERAYPFIEGIPEDIIQANRIKLYKAILRFRTSGGRPWLLDISIDKTPAMASILG